MPLYQYTCAACGPFEKRAGYNDHSLPCRCGEPASRAPFSGSVAMRVEGRVLISDSDEAQYDILKKNRESGWDYDRAIRHIRSGIETNERDGTKSVNLKKSEAAAKKKPLVFGGA